MTPKSPNGLLLLTSRLPGRGPVRTPLVVARWRCSNQAFLAARMTLYLRG